MEETEKTYTAWGLDEGEHETQGLKPMLTPEGQVELLKAKDVTFDRCSEEQAIEALSGRDTFLHTAAYRKLFQVHREGGKAGQYVKLDFADLLGRQVETHVPRRDGRHRADRQDEAHR